MISLLWTLTIFLCTDDGGCERKMFISDKYCSAHARVMLADKRIKFGYYVCRWTIVPSWDT